MRKGGHIVGGGGGGGGVVLMRACDILVLHATISITFRSDIIKPQVVNNCV